MKADHLKDLIITAVKLKQQNDFLPYTSLCRILNVDSITTEDGAIKITSKKVDIDDYLRTLPEKNLVNLIAGLMMVDETYRYLTVDGTRRFIAELLKSGEQFDWLKKKINEHMDGYGNHISRLLDDMYFVNSVSSELVRHFTVEEYIASLTSAGKKSLTKELSKLESRIKDGENAYDPEFSIGQGFEARAAAVALHIKVADLEAFVRNDMKARDWAIRQVIEAVQVKLAELENKAASKGLAMEKVLEHALPDSGKTMNGVAEEIKKSEFAAALRVIQATEDMLEKIERLGQFAKQAK